MGLCSADAFERRTICDREGGALQGDEIPGFEFAQRPRDRLASSTEKFRDLLVR